jgi:hypothetical protein
MNVFLFDNRAYFDSQNGPSTSLASGSGLARATVIGLFTFGHAGATTIFSGRGMGET